MNVTATRFFFAALLCFTVLNASAQDIHFSQFGNSPANLNPALTGVFAGDLRLIANYRSQWKSVPVDYRTLSAAFDTKLFHKALGKTGYLGYGLVFNNDVAGDAQIGISQVGANVAYTRQMGDGLFATVGVQFMASQRSFSPEKLTYAAQWNGDIFDPNRSNDESFTTTSKGSASISTGLNLSYQVDGTRTFFNVGAGIFHLNQPNTSFDGDPSAKLPMRLSPYLLASVQVAPKLDVRLGGSFAKQQKYQETLASAALQYHLSTEKNKELNVQAGVAFRFGDALIPTAALQVRNWTVGASYDVNTSPFQVATAHRGGPEVFLQYILWKVQPPPEFKACPVF